MKLKKCGATYVNETILMDDQLLEYLRQNSVREPDVAGACEETKTIQFRNANLSEQGQLMAMLVKLVNAGRL